MEPTSVKGVLASRLYSLKVSAATAVYLSVPLYCTGYGTSYWMERSEYPRANTGLWQICLETNSTRGDQNTTEWVCLDVKEYVVSDWGETWIPGVRALSTLALLFLIICAVLCSLAIHRSRSNYNLPFIYVAMATAFSSCMFAITVIIIYGIKICSQSVEDYRFSWSFFVYLLATCVSTVATCLLLANISVIFVLANAEIQSRRAAICQQAVGTDFHTFTV